MAQIAKSHKIEVIVVEETHTGNEEQFIRRGIIEGVICHDNATYIHSGIDNWSLSQ